MFGSACAIALLGLLEAVAIAKSIANQTREVLDCNRQCLAEGLANLVGGLFQCMPGSGSLTRSAINYQAGAVSRWSGVYSAAAVALVVLLLAPLAHYIPRAALAGILLVTAAGLIDRKRLSYALRASRYDASLVLATAGVAVFVGVEWSILIGTALSILLYVPRAARLHATELAMSSDRVVRDRLPTDPPCNRMLLFDLEGELFFGAAPGAGPVPGRSEEKAENRHPHGGAAAQADTQPRRRVHGAPAAFPPGDAGAGCDRAAVRRTPGLRRGNDEPAFPRLAAARACFPGRRAGRFFDLGRGAPRAYDLLGADMCDACPRRDKGQDNGTLYYMI